MTARCHYHCTAATTTLGFVSCCCIWEDRLTDAACFVLSGGVRDGEGCAGGIEDGAGGQGGQRLAAGQRTYLKVKNKVK